MEEIGKEYDNQRMEEMKEKYPNYEDMNVEDLDSELPHLVKDLREGETYEEIEDIKEEIAYVGELKRRRELEASDPGDPTQGQQVETYETEDLAREQLEEKYPNLSRLSYDELMDRGDRLLNEMILSGLDEDSFKEKSEELRYIRMLSNDYQRKSSLNELLKDKKEKAHKTG